MQINKPEIEKIRKKHNLSLIILHGSYANNKTHPQSDIDIAVVRNKPHQKLKLLNLITDLSQAIKTDSIDLSDLTHADPFFLFSATRQSKLLAGDRKDYQALLRKAFFRYNNYLPYLKMEQEFVKERISSYVSN